MQIISENDLAAHVSEVDDDGDVPHARCAFFGEEDDNGQDAMIRYWNTPYGVVLQAMHSNAQFRGRDMLRWLVSKYGPVNVVESIWEAYDFWRKMQGEGLVRTIEDAEGHASEQEANAIPFTQPLSGDL